MSVKVDVEYCGVCDYRNKCLELQKEVEQICPQAEVTCRQGRRGSFEVQVNNTLVHSKLGSMAFPVSEDVAQNVQNVLDGKPLTKCAEKPITDCSIQ